MTETYIQKRKNGLRVNVFRNGILKRITEYDKKGKKRKGVY